MNTTSQIKMISLIVAAYNEQPIIGQTIKTLIGYMNSEFSDTQWEIIIVDDGSTDDTSKIVNDAIRGNDNLKFIKHRRNYGQGRAFRTSFEKARGDVIVTLDADLSYEPRYIKDLVDKMESSDADIVIASAFLSGGGVVNIPFYRKVLTVVANKFLCLSTALDISAITCAVRAYRRDVVKRLPLNSDGMEMNLEVILKAQMLNLHVTEIPAVLKWAANKGVESKRRKRSSWNILKSIFRYLFFGYLFNPNLLFLMPLFLSLSVFALYGFSLSFLTISRIKYFLNNEPDQLALAISNSIRWTFANYTHAFYFLISSLVVSLFFFIIWFVTKQNKFYFEQTYSLASSLLEAQRKLEHRYK